MNVPLVMMSVEALGCTVLSFLFWIRSERLKAKLSVTERDLNATKHLNTDRYVALIEAHETIEDLRAKLRTAMLRAGEDEQ